MGMLDLIWPSYPDWNRRSSHDDPKTKEHTDAILKADWKTSPNTALALAERIALSEEERRKTTETKATNALLVIAALVTFLTYVEGILWNAQAAGGSKLFTIPILIAVVVYLLAAALWALRVVAVSNYAVLGTQDAIRIWANSGDAVVEKLTSEILLSTRLNQEEINRKITAYKASYDFLYRAIFALFLLITVQACWSFYRAIL